MACLARAFGEDSFIEEETCCPIEQTCDEQCCDGTCFAPLHTTVTGFNRVCCPAGGTFCRAPALQSGLCCEGDTPQCCVRDGLTVACIAEDACCAISTGGDSGCTLLKDPDTCILGFCNEEHVCEPQAQCPDLKCCREQYCCALSEECCPREVDGTPIFVCIDPATECCTDDDCEGMCQICEDDFFSPQFNTCVVDPTCTTTTTAAATTTTTTAAPTTTTAAPTTTADPCETVACVDPNASCVGGGCVCNSGFKTCPPSTACVPDTQCCTDCSELDNPAECLTGFCTGAGECEAQGCGPSEVCCGAGACQECCGSDVSNCPEFGIDVDCATCNNGVCQVANVLGQCESGICSDLGVCLPCLPENHSCNASGQCCEDQGLRCADTCIFL
jgi:hypothetical protein